MAIDPSFVTTTPEWKITGIGNNIEAPEQTIDSGSGGFGQMLGKQIANLEGLQEDAAKQAQSLASGSAEDPTSVVMAVERAKLSIQLATQIRDKSVTALQEILRTQV